MKFIILSALLIFCLNGQSQGSSNSEVIFEINFKIKSSKGKKEAKLEVKNIEKTKNFGNFDLKPGANYIKLDYNEKYLFLITADGTSKTHTAKVSVPKTKKELIFVKQKMSLAISDSGNNFSVETLSTSKAAKKVKKNVMKKRPDLLK
ncbi:MAG: hypothetical protein ACI857_001452 [Arenicella sp.]|jgi:hypothetical protein